MATGGSNKLTNSQIVRLAEAIAAKHMEEIAMLYFDIDWEELENSKRDHRDDIKAFNRDMIRKWAFKNSGPNQVQNLATLLYEAADKAYVDPNKVEEILGVSRSEAAEDTTNSGSCENPSEKDLSQLADALRQFTEQKTKVEMDPGMKGTGININELYTHVTIDKIENKPTGMEKTRIKDYMELFQSGGHEEHCTRNKPRFKKSRIPMSISKKKQMKTKETSHETCNSKAKVTDSQPKHEGQKLLFQGDPGTGKTTLSKKMANDWSKRAFTTFVIVFFLSMKLISPGQPIENIIIQQYPKLTGFEITPQKLRTILKVHGSECLLIIDGFDEAASDNDDILKLLKGELFLQCNVLLTSRPYNIVDIQDYFHVRCEVLGFTLGNAREYVSKRFKYRRTVMEVIEFNSRNFMRGHGHYANPLILCAICFLVKHGQTDLLRLEDVDIDEIYYRLFRCMYKTKRKTFDEDEFVDTLRKVGRLAWETLHSGKIFFQKAKVLADYGEKVFEFGFLVGREDNIAVENADICITFLHRSVQEFFGAFYFAHELHDTGNIQRLLGQISGNNQFLNSYSFLHFCIWFLKQTKYDLHLTNKMQRYHNLTSYVSNEIDVIDLNLAVLLDVHHSINVRYAANTKDVFMLEFFGDVLSKCTQIKRLQLSNDDPISWILDSMRHNLERLNTVEIISYLYGKFCFTFNPLSMPSSATSSDDLNIILPAQESHILDQLLGKLSGISKHLAVFVVPTAMEECLNLSDFVRQNIRKLYIICDNMNCCQIVTNRKLSQCPSLTHLCFGGLPVNKEVLPALCEAVQHGILPRFTHLNIIGNTLHIRRKVPGLFQAPWPTLRHLSFYSCLLEKSDIAVLSKQVLPNLTSLVLYLGSVSDIVTEEDLAKERKVGNKQPWLERSVDQAVIDMLKTPWPSLRKLWLHDVDNQEYKDIMTCFKSGHQNGLLEFGVSMWRLANKQMRQHCTVKVTDKTKGRNYRVMQDKSSVDKLPPLCLPSIVNLTLNTFIFSIEHLSVLQNTVLRNLQKLDVSGSSGITGRWSLLFGQTFLLLQILILSDCGLNPQDLVSLAKAKDQGRLPKLERLDVSKNNLLKDHIESLFTFNCRWNSLKYFDFEEEIPLGDVNLQVLANKIETGNLSALQTFKFATDDAQIFTKSSSLELQNLKEIEVFSPLKSFVGVLANITSAVENDVFPALRTMDMAILHPELDSRSSKNVADELAALTEKLKLRNIPEQNVNHVILSFRNSLLNLQNTFHVESMKMASDCSFREGMEHNEAIEALAASATDTAVKSLSSENWTRHHLAVLRSCLCEFYVKIFKIVCRSDRSISLLKDMLVLLPSIKYRLAKCNVSLTFFRMSKYPYRYVF